MVGADDDFTRALLVKAGLRPGMRVLDAGCGRGDVALIARALVGEAGSVTGLDRDPGALAVARQRAGDGPGTVFVAGDVAAPPADLGVFDAVVGRRVLMYQRDPAATLRGLAGLLVANGVIAFQEHDVTVAPTSLAPMPLHARVQGWLRRMVEHEGADPQIGFNLHGAATRAGLRVDVLRAEAVLQTPDAPYALAEIVRAVLPRLVAAGAASETEVDLPTLPARLDAERAAGTYLGGLTFGLIARKAA